MIPWFRNLFADYRRTNGLTRKQVAIETGFSESFIQKFENEEILTNTRMENIFRLGDYMRMSKYNTLISLRDKTYVLGIDLSGDPVPEDIMFQELNNKYAINALGNLIDILSVDMAAVSVKTNISEVRLNEIKKSRLENFSVSVNEAILICKALNKKFSEIFALVAEDFRGDQNAINIAQTLQNYIENQRIPETTFGSEIAIDISNDEKEFLIEMLTAFRKLRLSPQKPDHNKQ
ncbi:helix-turn-helix domain-containing protein [Paenibacillus sp. URB8-2]|uniref:helix-turn-helix domain-containing protein n=1 Tax=Paenibacillus sp. URB8-2 TaxID=2741301 RepID=UPI0015B8FE4E|nr:helix-turn-helix transcriptional regulator [Paenibacillus sp. URB8-2]BCG59726.1 hypothetical protein PUR_31510 [Paenibacillus sp. URB8-2]